MVLALLDKVRDGGVGSEGRRGEGWVQERVEEAGTANESKCNQKQLNSKEIAAQTYPRPPYPPFAAGANLSLLLS